MIMESTRFQAEDFLVGRGGPHTVGMLADRLRAAINAHDIDAFMACFDDGYDSVQPAHPGREFHGPDQVRKNWTTLFREVPDVRAELLAKTEDSWRGVGRVALARNTDRRQRLPDARYDHRGNSKRPGRPAAALPEEVEQTTQSIDAAVQELTQTSTPAE